MALRSKNGNGGDGSSHVDPVTIRPGHFPGKDRIPLLEGGALPLRSNKTVFCHGVVFSPSAFPDHDRPLQVSYPFTRFQLARQIEFFPCYNGEGLRFQFSRRLPAVQFLRVPTPKRAHHPATKDQTAGASRLIIFRPFGQQRLVRMVIPFIGMVKDFFSATAIQTLWRSGVGREAGLEVGGA